MIAGCRRWRCGPAGRTITPRCARLSPCSDRGPRRDQMSKQENIDIVLAAFSAVERRDDQWFADFAHPDVEFHWPPSLPYGGSFRRGEVETRRGPTWSETWEPLQPTWAEQ